MRKNIFETEILTQVSLSKKKKYFRSLMSAERRHFNNILKNIFPVSCPLAKIKRTKALFSACDPEVCFTSCCTLLRSSSERYC